MPTICIIQRRKYPLTEKDIIDGGTLNVFAIVNELQHRGYDVDIFTRRDEGEADMVKQAGACIYRVSFARSSQRNVLLRDYEEGKSFVEGVLSHSAFKPKKYNCIHTHHWTSGVAIAAGIPKQTKLIHTPHLLAAEKAFYNNLDFPSCVEAAEQELLIRANHIIALSESEKTSALEKYSCSNDKIIVAPNGINTGFFHLPLHINPGNQTSSVLFIGRLCRQKGVDVLLNSAEHVVKSGIPFSVRLVGNSYGEPEFDKLIEKRLSSAPLAAIVERIKEIPHDNILPLMNNSFIYVQPSRYESQGVALLEAMAAGRVVIASNLPAIREYIRHGENGYLIDSENSQALANILIELLTNPKQVLSLPHAARETARKYSWQSMLQTIMPLFE